MSRRAVFRLIASAMIVVALSCTQALGANSPVRPASTSPPRYKLSVGQELAYRYQNISATFYVTRSNPDGGWHVFEIRRFPAPRIKDPASGGALIVPELKCEFDLMPDCKLGDKPIGRTDDAKTFLPKLPPNATIGEWESSRPKGESIRFHLLPSTQPSEQDFEGPVSDANQRPLNAPTACRARFDTALGLPVQFQFDVRLPNEQHIRWAVDLVDNQVHPASWANHFDQEATVLMRAHRQYLHAMQVAGGASDDKQAMAGFDGAVKELEETRSRITVPALLEVIDSYVRIQPEVARLIRSWHDTGHSPGPVDIPTQ